MAQNYQIVVGVDGSDGSRRALRWAVDEAASRGGAIQAVTAWQWDGIEMPPPVAPNPTAARQHATEMLHREIDAIPVHRRSGLVIALEAIEGRPGDVLTTAAAQANLLVLGSHGHNRAWHAVLGSVSEECVRKATCPVVVVPVPQHTHPPSAPPAVPSVPATA
jgi:nucleotide-binding universal stress UspA family protein